jgi:hypothetical protein
MADELSGHGAGVAALGRAERPDAILEVTGVSAAEILQRCRELRGSSRTPARAASIRRALAWSAPAPDARCLLDFADLGAADFVREAHRVLLGRRASSADVERRVDELRSGRPRMAIIVRLALSPEGRRARRPPVGGIGLPALALTGAAIETMKASSLLGPAATQGEQVVRSTFARPGARRSRKLLLSGAALAVWAAARSRRS